MECQNSSIVYENYSFKTFKTGLYHIRRVCHRQKPPETLQELRDTLANEWNNLPKALIQLLIGSMRRRCEAVVAARGDHTRY